MGPCFTVPRDGAYLVHCVGIPSLFVDDVPLVGDLYGAGLGHSPVHLAAGVEHRLRVRLRAKIQTQLSCAVGGLPATPEEDPPPTTTKTTKKKKVSKVLSAPKVTVAPDLLDGLLSSPWVGVVRVEHSVDP